MRSQLLTNILMLFGCCLLAVLILQNAGIIQTPKKDVQIVSIIHPKKADFQAGSRWDPIDGEVIVTEPVEIKKDGF